MRRKGFIVILLLFSLCFSLSLTMSPHHDVESQIQTQIKPGITSHPTSYSPLNLNYSWSEMDNGILNIPTKYSLGTATMNGVNYGNMISNPSFESGDSTGWTGSSPITTTVVSSAEPTYTYGSTQFGTVSNTQQLNADYQAAQSIAAYTSSVYATSVPSNNPVYAYGYLSSGSLGDTVSDDSAYQISTSTIYYVSPTSSQKYFAYGTDDNRIGTLVWTNPTYVAGSPDANWATATGTAYQTVDTYYLKGYSGTFSIPSSVVIQGIKLEVYKRSDGGASSYHVTDYSVRLVDNSDNIVGTNHASSSWWSTSSGWVTYGGPDDLWDVSWTYDMINSPNFGAVVSAELYSTSLVSKAYVDSYRITVYYATPNYQVDYYHSFQFTSASMSSVSALAWSANGKSSSPNIEIYVWSFGSSSWVDQSVYWTSSESTKTDTETTSFINANGYMYMRFAASGVASSFTVSVDQIYWTVTYQYRISYYYLFSFSASSRANVQTLTWTAVGHASISGVHIRLWNYVTSAFDDTGKTWSTGDTTKSASVLAATYMDASGNMKMSFYFEPNNSAFTVSADYLYWTVVWQAGLGVAQTAVVNYGSYALNLTSSGDYRYQLFAAWQCNLTSNLVLMGAMLASTIPTATNDMEIYLDICNATGNHIYFRYQLSTAVTADTSTSFYFLIGSSSATWYGMFGSSARNITADMLFKQRNTAPRYVAAIYLLDASGGTNAMYFDSIALLQDPRISTGTNIVAGGNTYAEFEYPTLIGTDPSDYPIGWTGETHTGTAVQVNTGIGWSSPSAYLHYWRLWDALTAVSGNLKDIYYDLGTNPPGNLSFALDLVTAGAAGNIASVILTDLTTSKRLVYEFGTGASAIYTESSTLQVIHEQLTAGTQYYRFKMWIIDWMSSSQYGVVPTLSDSWRLSVEVYNSGTATAMTCVWDSIWMGDTNTPEYQTFMFSDARNPCWMGFAGENAAANGFGFDYDGIFGYWSSGASTTAGLQLTWFNPSNSYNYHRVSVCVGVARLMSWTGTAQAKVVFMGATTTTWFHYYLLDGSAYESSMYYWVNTGGVLNAYSDYIFSYDILSTSERYSMLRLYAVTSAASSFVGWMTLKWMSVEAGDTLAPSQVTLNSPFDGETVSGSLNTTWDPATDSGGSGLKTYREQLSLYPDFSTLYASYNTTSTWYVLSSLSAGNWYWRVDAVDDQENAGAWSVPRRFVVDNIPPTAPVPLSPGNGSYCSNTQVVFIWNSSASTDIAYYRIAASLSPTFASVIFNTTTTYTAYTYTAPVGNPLPGSWVYWKVSPVDLVGNFGGWSVVFTAYPSGSGIVYITYKNQAGHTLKWDEFNTTIYTSSLGWTKLGTENSITMLTSEYIIVSIRDLFNNLILNATYSYPGIRLIITIPVYSVTVANNDEVHASYVSFYPIWLNGSQYTYPVNDSKWILKSDKEWSILAGNYTLRVYYPLLGSNGTMIFYNLTITADYGMYVTNNATVDLYTAYGDLGGSITALRVEVIDRYRAIVKEYTDAKEKQQILEDLNREINEKVTPVASIDTRLWYTIIAMVAIVLLTFIGLWLATRAGHAKVDAEEQLDTFLHNTMGKSQLAGPTPSSVRYERNLDRLKKERRR